MTETPALSPANTDEVVEAVRWALSKHTPLEIVGGGTKRSVGHPGATNMVLDVSHITGIVAYEPKELVITALPGTPLADIEAALADAGQRLDFEPVNLNSLLGVQKSAATLGGMVAGNIAGPRRIKTGAVRDHVLGMKIVTGWGEAVKTGGRVVKNVTGYDLCKVLTGSWGTLSVMTELSLKTLPAPETETTILIEGLDDASGTAALSASMGSPYDVSGAAHLPGAQGTSLSCIRLEGIEVSVAARRDALIALLGSLGSIRYVDPNESMALWQSIRDVHAFVETPGAVWRISTAPDQGASVVADISEVLACAYYFDWSGGLIWLSCAADGDAGASVIRATVEGRGHATLIRAPENVRREVSVFHPQPAPLADLAKRVKASFDPDGVFNPKRMTLDW